MRMVMRHSLRDCSRALTYARPVHIVLLLAALLFFWSSSAPSPVPSRKEEQLLDISVAIAVRELEEPFDALAAHAEELGGLLLRPDGGRRTGELIILLDANASAAFEATLLRKTSLPAALVRVARVSNPSPWIHTPLGWKLRHAAQIARGRRILYTTTHVAPRPGMLASMLRANGNIVGCTVLSRTRLDNVTEDVVLHRGYVPVESTEKDRLMARESFGLRLRDCSDLPVSSTFPSIHCAMFNRDPLRTALARRRWNSTTALTYLDYIAEAVDIAEPQAREHWFIELKTRERFFQAVLNTIPLKSGILSTQPVRSIVKNFFIYQRTVSHWAALLGFDVIRDGASIGSPPFKERWNIARNVIHAAEDVTAFLHLLRDVMRAPVRPMDAAIWDLADAVRTPDTRLDIPRGALAELRWVMRDPRQQSPNSTHVPYGHMEQNSMILEWPLPPPVTWDIQSVKP